MMFNIKKNIRKAGISALVLAQIAACGVIAPMSASAFAGSAITRNMENLDRGVVATKTNDGVLVMWRRLGTEPADTEFTLYKNDQELTKGAITNYLDASGTTSDKYTVVCNGTMSKTVDVWENGYLDIPMGETPESDVVQMDRNGVYIGSYAPGDASYGDLDGDGEYEIVVMWNPSDAKDAATTGQTGLVFVDAYKLDGTQLWRINMGPNIRAGQHDTMFAIADYDNDGKAELIFRTADGTVDGTGVMIGDAEKGTTYENSWAALNYGKNLQGPLYVTLFDGETGKAEDTTEFVANNKVGDVSETYKWGDNFGNRSERYNATVAYLDGANPSAILGRGYYGGKDVGPGRTSVSAYGVSGGKLKLLWNFDTTKDGSEYIGQGNHQMEAGDADGDGKDEIFTGALTLDDNGKVLWCSGYGHGDAMHLGDFDPTHEGLEFMKVNEEGEHAYNTALGADTAMHGADETSQIWGMTVHEAATGKLIQSHNGVKDTGRGMIANIGYGDKWYATWAAGSTGYWDSDGNALPDLGASMNGRIYWDGDLQDELQDHNGTEVTLTKWNDSSKKFDEIFVAPGSHEINGTKGNMNAQGDLIGDWREEIVSYTVLDEKSDSKPMTIKGDWDKDVEVELTSTVYTYGMRIYVTPYPTNYNFYTLAHDDIYRNSSGAYSNCYNQPPHVSWYMNDAISGSTYTTQPEANIKLVGNDYTAPAFDASLLPAAGASSTPSQPSQSTTPSSGAPFTDTNGHWAKEYIDEMYLAKIVTGVTDTTYEPESQVTRAEFATLISRAVGLNASNSDSGHWATNYVNAIKEAGLVDASIPMATDADLDSPISREEMASMVTKGAAYKNVEPSVSAENAFIDADQISAWAVQDVKNAVALGIINGINTDAGTEFQPKNNATRAEAATMLSRMLAAIK